MFFAFFVYEGDFESGTLLVLGFAFGSRSAHATYPSPGLGGSRCPCRDGAEAEKLLHDGVDAAYLMNDALLLSCPTICDLGVAILSHAKKCRLRF